MNIYLDFDGTIVEHDYPRIGKLNPNSLEIIKKLQETGHTVILNTMRIEFEDDSMQEALDFINRNETVSGINISQKTGHKVFPKKWNLDKIENDLYIDDIAPNIPLINATEVEGFMVDWVKIEKQLTEKGII